MLQAVALDPGVRTCAYAHTSAHAFISARPANLDPPAPGPMLPSDLQSLIG